MDQVVLDFVEDRGGGAERRSGFTRTLRMLLIKEKGPITARTMSEELISKHPELASRHKNLVVSVTPILNRLVSYGEACSIELDGKRAWQWAGKDYATSSRSIDESPTES